MRSTIIIASLTLVGCASGLSGTIQEPKFDLARIVVQGVGLSGGRLDLVLNVNNPNRFDLPGTKLPMALDIEGHHFGDLLLSDSFNLKKEAVTPLTVPLTFQWSSIGPAARSVLDYGTVNYSLKGNATVQVPGGSRDVPFAQQGSVPIGRLGGH